MNAIGYNLDMVANLTEAADYLTTSEDLVWRLVKEGALASTDSVRRRFCYILWSDLTSFKQRAEALAAQVLLELKD